jgi:hypothetical protein
MSHPIHCSVRVNAISGVTLSRSSLLGANYRTRTRLPSERRRSAPSPAPAFCSLARAVLLPRPLRVVAREARRTRRRRARRAWIRRRRRARRVDPEAEAGAASLDPEARRAWIRRRRRYRTPTRQPGASKAVPQIRRLGGWGRRGRSRICSGKRKGEPQATTFEGGRGIIGGEFHRAVCSSISSI